MKSTRKKKKIGSCKTAKKTLKFQCTVYSILWIAQENIVCISDMVVNMILIPKVIRRVGKRTCVRYRLKRHIGCINTYYNIYRI